MSMFFSVVARRNLGRQASMLGQLSSMSKANFLLKLLLQYSPMLAYLRSLRPAEVIHPLCIVWLDTSVLATSRTELQVCEQIFPMLTFLEFVPFS